MAGMLYVMDQVWGSCIWAAQLLTSKENGGGGNYCAVDEKKGLDQNEIGSYFVGTLVVVKFSKCVRER
jgi:hypothetical protein